MSLELLGSRRNNQYSAFGETSVAERTPQVQVKFPYNLNTDVVQVLTNNASSSVATSGGVCTVTCAGAASAFSQIRTLDVVRYGPGQGALFMGTCAFTTGVANSSQVFGPGDDDEGFFFGYNGTSFGVLRRSAGALEIRSITITGAADGTGGTFTITMDGTAVTITVAASDTIAEVCAAIVAASADFYNAGRGWEVHTDDNITVEFISLVAENAAGTFSFADVDSGVTAGTFQQSTTAVLGVAPTETWVAQTAWNGDRFDGTGSSGVTLDPTKLNVFRIQYQYLGAGAVEFSIEDPETGRFSNCHTIKYANTATIPTLVNPTLHLNLIAKTESGYSGGTLVMKTASMAGFIEGPETLLGVRHAANNTKSTTTTTPVNILTIHNELDWQSAKNKVVVYPDLLTIATEATKTTIVKLIVNPTQVNGTVALTAINANTSVMEKDVAGTTVVGGTELLSIVLEGGTGQLIDLKALNVFLRPGDRWVFTAELSSGGSDGLVSVGVTWLERI